MALINVLLENIELCNKIKELHKNKNIENAIEISKIKREFYYFTLKNHTVEFHQILNKIKKIKKTKNYSSLLIEAKKYKKNNIDFVSQLETALIFKTETVDYDLFLNEALELKNNNNDFNRFLQKNITTDENIGLFEFYKPFINSNKIIEYDFLLHSEIFLIYEECLCLIP